VDLAQQYGNKIMENTVATGAAWHVEADLDMNIIHDTFGKVRSGTGQYHGKKAGHACSRKRLRCSFVPSTAFSAKMLIPGIASNWGYSIRSNFIQIPNDTLTGS
jgi:hypothetical protein